MKTAKCKLESLTPYSQSKRIYAEKKNKEMPQDYEARVWREHLHVNESGNVFIPQMALKNCLSDAALFLSVQIPGKGKTTWTKHFEAGLIVVEPIVLPVKKDDVEGEWHDQPANGQRGSGKRVAKCYPVIPKWAGTAEYIIVDDLITEDVFTYHLKQAGSLIGIGRFRPRKNGYYGRFKVISIDWCEDA